MQDGLSRDDFTGSWNSPCHEENLERKKRERRENGKKTKNRAHVLFL